MKWSIQVFYTARDDDSKPFRAETLFHVEADDIPSAYSIAENADWGGVVPVKLGFILPGWHDSPAIGATKEIVKKKGKK